MNRVIPNALTALFVSAGIFYQNFFQDVEARDDYVALASGFLGIFIIRDSLIWRPQSYRMKIAKWTFLGVGALIASLGIATTILWNSPLLLMRLPVTVSVQSVANWLFAASLLIFLLHGAPEKVLRPIFSTQYRIYPMFGYITRVFGPPIVLTILAFLVTRYEASFVNHMTVFGSMLAVTFVIYRAWEYAGDRLSTPKASKSEIAKRRNSTVIFEDNFEEFSNWEWIGEGRIEQSNTVAFSGQYSLKKDGKNDPFGGYKVFQNPTGLGFVFAGWLYHPSDRKGGSGDRLAVEDKNFNGYGFCIVSRNKLSIEARNSKSPETLGNAVEIAMDPDVWYRFRFEITEDSNISIQIFDQENTELARIDGIHDTRYTNFDRVVVHGGHQYYIDDLRIEKT